MKAVRISRAKRRQILDALAVIGQSGPGWSEGATVAARQVQTAMERSPAADEVSVRPSQTSEWALHRAVYMVTGKR